MACLSYSIYIIFADIRIMEKTYIDEINKKKIEDRTALEELLTYKLDENISKEVVDLLEEIYTTKKTKITNEEWEKLEVERYNMENVLDELKQVINDFYKTVDNEEVEEDTEDEEEEEEEEEEETKNKKKRHRFQ